MQLIPELLVAGAVILVGAVYPGGYQPEQGTLHPARASVRFTNNLTSTATISTNSTVLFRDVAPATTTEWGSVTDSVVVFTVTVPGEGHAPATVDQVIEEGAKYTVTADPGPEGTPMVKVKREAAMPTPDSTAVR
ncbi:MAG TPA: hypothetical protein VFN22_07095 [Gemmatimonadales bacterium]|nr:hypothetical protein [Gemmatimonadales bacterium]